MTEDNPDAAEVIVRRFAPPEPVPDEELADQPPADPTVEGTEGLA